MENIVCTSTPRSKPRPRRSTVLQNVTNTLHLRRIGNLINQSLTPQHEVDDELERSIRRNEAEFQRRIFSTPSPNRSSQVVVDENEMRDHFQVCLRLYAENKINAKNAWNLKIIDYMRTVLYSQVLDRNSLQIAGTSLDVSAKIYGLRVDNVHTEILKLANDMARVVAAKEGENAQNSVETNDDNGNDNSRRNQERRRKKRRSMRTGNKDTIAKDPTSLLQDVVKVESVFFQTHVNMQYSPADNLFTNKLPMNYGRYKFMFLSKERAWPSYKKKDKSIRFETKYPFKILEIQNLHICPAFNDFKIDEWDLEQEIRLVYERSQMVIEDDDIVFDEHGIPMPELDGSVHDFFADGDLQADNQGTQKVTTVGEIPPGERNLGANDYGYTNIFIGNNKLITYVWAGPSHWKLKHIHRTESRFSGRNENHAKTVKKVKLQPTLIDFETDEPPYDKSEIYKPRKINIDKSPHKCTLPQVMLLEHKPYGSLMLRPGVYIELDRNNNKKQGHGCSYNFENSGDHSYFSQHNNYVNVGNNKRGKNIENSMHHDERDMSMEHHYDEALTGLPELVPKSYISYALKPKTMDMKRLKKAIWKILTDSKPEETVNGEDKNEHGIIKKTFAEMYKQIPSQISHNMQKELSCHLTFVALLHLCNEKNLELKLGDQGDFIIQRL